MNTLNGTLRWMLVLLAAAVCGFAAREPALAGTGLGGGGTPASRALYSSPADFPGAGLAQGIDRWASGALAAPRQLAPLALSAAPVAADDSYHTPEDTPLSVPAAGVLSNDSDPDSDPISATLVTGPLSGGLLLAPTGAFTYTADLNFNGVITFTYQATDGSASSNTATVTISITPVNDPPVAVSDTYNSAEDTPLAVAAPGVLGNDIDPESSQLTAALITGPASGSLTLNSNGSFSYTPAANANGAVTFTYEVSDGSLPSNIAIETINLAPVNDPPTAANDSYATDEDTPLTILAPGVLANDRDIEGSPLEAVLVSPPASGSLTFNSNGSFSYTPAANASGDVTFTYQSNDGSAGSNTATVTITLNPLNDPPIAANDAYTTDEDTSLTIAAPGVLGNDSDPESSPLTAVLVSGPASGSLTLDSDGSFSYTPAANVNGPVTFTYQASDGTLTSNTATVTITMNPVEDPPVAVDDSYSTPEDTQLVVDAPGVLGNDYDPENNPITATLVSPPSSGVLSLRPDGYFTYDPVPNFNGPVSFTYQARHGNLLSNVATVTINVTAVNDPPVAGNDTYTTNEDTPLSITAPGVLGNDSDPESSPLTAVLVSGPASGSLTLNSNGSFSYTPAANANGPVTFTYQASDGTLNSNTATVTINITPVDDPPVAVNDAYTTPEDTPLSVAAPGVLDNDTDVESSTLTAALVSPPASGSLTLNSNGSFSYTPAANFSGPVTFTYQASDGTASSNTATVTITVNPVNDPPAAANDSYSISEDTQLSVSAPGVLGNDSDPESSPLTAVLVAGPTSGALTLNANGSFVYTPAANYNGQVTFTYQASDGAASSNTATVTITITPVNDAPSAANDAYNTNEDVPLTVDAAGVLANDVDVDGDTLTAILIDDVTAGTLTLNADGSFAYTPEPNSNGLVLFSYQVFDGTAYSAIASVSITIASVNDAPVAVNDSYTTNEDTPLSVSSPGILANDSDVEGDPLNAVLVAGPGSGTLTLNSSGSFSFTPATNFNGPATFTYQANDGAANSNTATVTIQVIPINDPPVAVNDAFTTAEDTPRVANVTANDSDADGNLNPASVTIISQPSNGAASVNPTTGEITYTPALNYFGSDSLTYQVCDLSLSCATASVNYTVTSVNDPPVANDDTGATSEDTAVTLSVLGNDNGGPSNEAQTLSIASTTAPANGSVVVNPDKTIRYTPAANYCGSDSFTYTAQDTGGLQDAATVNLTIACVNDPPVAVDDSAATPEDTPVVINVLSNDTDVENNINAGSVTITVIPSHGVASVNTSNGAVTYTPNANYNGADSFTYQVCDTASACDSAIASLTITAVNDPPVAADDATTTPEDAPVTIPVVDNDFDVDGNLNPGSVTVTVAPGHGSTAVNPTTGAITYTPALNYNGSDVLTYRVCDTASVCDTAQVSINVGVVNDPPVANNDSAATPEDTPVTINVLSNDTDVDGNINPASVTVSTAPADGTTSVNTTTGAITYTPSANFFGSDSLIYQVCDTSGACDSATVSLTVTPVNDPPDAVGDSPSVNEDSQVVISVLSNDNGGPSNESQALTVVSATTPSHGSAAINAGATITYDPAADYCGSDSFNYTIRDSGNLEDTATVNVTVICVNDPPVAVDDSATTPEDTAAVIDVLANDTDLENNIDPASETVTNGPSNGSTAINLTNGRITYTPGLNYYGSDQFVYQVCDTSSACDSANVSLTITPVNDPPAAADDTASTIEDTPVTISALGNDTGGPPNESQVLTIAAVSTPAYGSAAANPDKTITYTPAADYCGSDSFTYTARDSGGLQDTASVSLTISCVNDPPVANNDAASTPEDTPIVIGVLSNDTDAEGNLDPTSVAIVAAPANGSAEVNSLSGEITYSPAANYNGSDNLSYQVCDTALACDLATVSLLVTPVNDAPLVRNDSANTPEDTPVTIDVLLNDTDIDLNLDPASLTVTSEPANGTVQVNALTKDLTYTPAANFNGTDFFDYQACDTGRLCDSATVRVIISPVNDMPLPADDAYILSLETAVNGKELVIPNPGVLANDVDFDPGDVLVAQIVSQPGQGTVSLADDGGFVYTPPASFNGETTFTYQANDGVSGMPAVVTITVDMIRPQVTWLSPVPDGGVYDVFSSRVTLQVNVSDNLQIDRVRFIWWDRVKSQWTELGIIHGPPYQLILDTSALYLEWNELRAVVYDAAGNSTISNRILLFRMAATYLPFLVR